MTVASPSPLEQGGQGQGRQCRVPRCWQIQGGGVDEPTCWVKTASPLLMGSAQAWCLCWCWCLCLCLGLSWGWLIWTSDCRGAGELPPVVFGNSLGSRHFFHSSICSQSLPPSLRTLLSLSLSRSAATCEGRGAQLGFAPDSYHLTYCGRSVCIILFPLLFFSISGSSYWFHPSFFQSSHLTQPLPTSPFGTRLGYSVSICRRENKDEPLERTQTSSCRPPLGPALSDRYTSAAML